MSVEDWTEIRRLNRADRLCQRRLNRDPHGTPVAVIARQAQLVSKLGVDSRAEALRVARDNGWLQRATRRQTCYLEARWAAFSRMQSVRLAVDRSPR